MEKTEKKLLDVVALSSIVIALGTFGSMMITLRAAFPKFLLFEDQIAFLLFAAVGLVAIYYTGLSIYLFHKKV